MYVPHLHGYRKEDGLSRCSEPATFWEWDRGTGVGEKRNAYFHDRPAITRPAITPKLGGGIQI